MALKVWRIIPQGPPSELSKRVLPQRISDLSEVSSALFSDEAHGSQSDNHDQREDDGIFHRGGAILRGNKVSEPIRTFWSGHILSSSNAGQSMMVAYQKSEAVGDVPNTRTLGAGWGPDLVAAKSHRNVGLELQIWLSAQCILPKISLIFLLALTIKMVIEVSSDPIVRGAGPRIEDVIPVRYPNLEFGRRVRFSEKSSRNRPVI